ncbi:MAG: hypothetical protein RI953_3079 [Pseudomonadota bacterium]|jgi:hypothetical protein
MKNITNRLKSTGGWCVNGAAFGFLLAGNIACVDTPASTKNPSNLSAQSLMDPNAASATVSSATKRFEGLKGDVPVVSISYGGADSAEVWRCRASFSMVYGNGLQKLSDLPKSSPEYRAAAAEAFKRMRGELSSCRAIASATTAQTVTDFAATEGKFYYVVNPCVSEAASTTKRAGCSFALEITPVLDYKNTRTDYEVEVLAGMSSAEGRLYGNFNGMRRAAEEANTSYAACVEQAAADRAQQAQLMGLIKLVSAAVVTPLVNGLMAGVGTALNGAINELLGKAAPQQIMQIDCPPAKVKLEYYNQLQSQTVQIAKEVLEARSKLAEFDSQYASVEKELAALKSGNK